MSRTLRASSLYALLLVPAVTACAGNIGPGDSGMMMNGGDGGTDARPVIDSDAGMPCDIQTFLQTYCNNCHGATPAGGAPVSFTTYAELMAPSLRDPSQTYAQRIAARLHDTMTPMPPPPAAPPPADQIAMVDNWVNGGAQPGTMMCMPVNDVFSQPPTCTSGVTWTLGNRESSSMNPGQACIACHTQMFAPRFNVAGTVYATGHDPENCNGTNDSTATVEITDAMGQVVMLHPNRAGNFYYEPGFTRPNLTPPYNARVLYQGRERRMLTPQMSGDCNSCHTAMGDMGAPGRVALP